MKLIPRNIYIFFLIQHFLLIRQPTPRMLVTNPVSHAGIRHLHVIVQQVQSQQLAINQGCGNSSRGLKTNTDS